MVIDKNKIVQWNYEIWVVTLSMASHLMLLENGVEGMQDGFLEMIRMTGLITDTCSIRSCKDSSLPYDREEEREKDRDNKESLCKACCFSHGRDG